MVSVWSATAEIPSYDELRADEHAEIVVVGGGWVGLTTALLLAQTGADVVLLEARRLGARTSGNTTAKVTSQHGAIYADLVDRHGKDKARLYAEANQAAVDQVAGLVQQYGIDCEFLRTPAYVYSSEPGSLKGEAEAAISLGLPAELTDGSEVGVPAVEAVRFDGQVQLHPVKYLAGLAAAFTAAGGRIYEQTRVVELDEEDDGVQATTQGGPKVRATHAVVATLLPFGLTGGYFARTRPQQSHGIAVRLPVEAPVGMAISTGSPVRSTRPWPGGGPNGLIVVGGGHETGSVEDTEAIYQSLTDWVGSTWNFSCRPEYRWSAHDYSTPDLIPYVGRSPGSRSTFVATGMHKWGLSNGTVAAGIIRDLITGRDNPAAGLYHAGRIGDAHAVAKLLKDNLKVGKDFATGHLGRAVHGGLDHLEVGQGGLFEIDGDTVGAYRDEAGALHTVKPICTHVGCVLNWNNADTTWDCNCHGSRFSPDGAVLDGPATKPLDRT
ncbi:FAD-dependent oxidoreductase [Kribbella sp. CA-293567]|uniref:FAD-dependent oxidoreductase n=1 Tax=Kribbella sp. CA-293567 TaxID=3002436 RepID=UPI0022DE2260|nr:FAD-dependent oxidoreductase [Kribbella sp. CA-293567]WBQ03503.1 FAD-dependent oxidoreductase [Kribbella sp. CA-293567]